MANVLVIDDSATDRRLLEQWLQALGHRPLLAEDAASGLRMAFEIRPDAIVMDVVMPGQNGFEATRLLVRDPRTCAIPIILISTKTQLSDMAWGRRIGAKAYLAKPFSQDQLGDALRAAWAE